MTELKNFGTVNKKELKAVPEKNEKKKINLEIMQAMPELSPQDRKKALEKMSLEDIRQLQQESPTQVGCDSPLLRRVKMEIQQTKSAVGSFLVGFGIKPMQPVKSAQGDSVITGKSKSPIKSKDAAKPMGLAGLFGGGATTPIQEVKEPTAKPESTNLAAKPAAKPRATGSLPLNSKPTPKTKTPVRPTPTKPAKPSNTQAKTLKPGNRGPNANSAKKTPKKPATVPKFKTSGVNKDISEVPAINDIDLDHNLEEALLAELEAPSKTPESPVRADHESISFNEKSASPAKDGMPSWAAEEEEEEKEKEVEKENDNVYSRMKLLASYMRVGKKRRTKNLDDEDF